MPEPEIALKTRRKEERPHEILESALKEFSEKGFASARLEDIARHAGISKGTIYLYFKSKEDLFHEMIRHWILPQLEKIEAVARDPGSAEDILSKLLEIIYDNLVSTDARHIPRLIIGEGTRFPELARFYHREVIVRFHRSLRAILERGVASGEFRPSVLEWKLQPVFSPALTAALWKLIFDSIEPLQIDVYRKTHIDLLLHGLKK